MEKWESSVGIANGYVIDGRRWAYTATYPMRTRGGMQGKKRTKREGDHSPPASSEVGNIWTHPLPHKSSWRSD
jgi:hypothetical protein